MEGVRERAGRALDRMLEYADVMQRVDRCAGEARRHLYAHALELRGSDRKPWEIEPVAVPVGRRVEPPRYLRPVLGAPLDVERLVVDAAQLAVEGREGVQLLRVGFNSGARLDTIIWLALIVGDWSEVVGKVQDEEVRRCVEAVAAAAEGARAALEGATPPAAEEAEEGARLSGRFRELILDAVEVLAEEGQRDAARWRISLFKANHLHWLSGAAVTLHPRRGARVPERVARLVSGLHGIGPPYTLESVRAYDGDIELYVRGLGEGGKEEGRHFEVVSGGTTSVEGILLASCFMEDEDWMRLTATRKELLGDLEEACRRVRAAALLCRLLA
jgi:hypothetical protein